MSRKKMADIVANNCHTNTKDAECIIEKELDNCRDILHDGNLTYEDLEDTCIALGLDFDYIEDFIERLI